MNIPIYYECLKCEGNFPTKDFNHDICLCLDCEKAIQADPICGNCQKPLSKHFHETVEYCYSHTNGDIYTEEPDEQMIANRVVDENPEIYDACVAKWKRENGHIGGVNESIP